MPVAGLTADGEYEEVVRTVVSEEQAGLCLRLLGSDMQRITLQIDIDRFLARMGCTPDNVYVLVDLKYIDENHLPSLEEICTRLPYLSELKSVVLALETHISRKKQMHIMLAISDIQGVQQTG